MHRLLLTLLVFLFPLAARAELPTEVLTVISPAGEVHRFRVEVARSPEDLQRGLMLRTELGKDAGMLFVYPQSKEIAMWMKNTLIPLDMLFISADGTIGKVHSGAIPGDLTPIPSGGPVIAAVEIRGGRAAELGIEAGSRVTAASLHPVSP